eukprot:1528187-Karenia_brevis.AAC.1
MGEAISISRSFAQSLFLVNPSSRAHFGESSVNIKSLVRPERPPTPVQKGKGKGKESLSVKG